ncbi:MAG TPA: ABC transporter substrate-binding protein [Bosea sp. (in: a-proteobacteria)]|nr:ABC transporter substrate-binding protein [Bosea sp. (in: a-proteobacteria)]
MTVTLAARRMMFASALAWSGLVAAQPAVRAQSNTPVKIGVLTDQSGAAADFSGRGTVLAARMAVEDFGGKVLGRPIELLDGDHLSKPDLGVALARRWYDEGVEAIFDVGLTSIAIGVQQLARDKNKVVVYLSTGSTDITGKYCSPNGIHWTYDTYSQANGAFLAYGGSPKDSWYFLTMDYAYGANLERDVTNRVAATGGKVLGTSKHSFEATDFASDILRAQSSKATVVGLMTTTMHSVTVMKQVEEFGLRAGGQRVAAPALTFHDIKALGLPIAHDLMIVEAFYWDLNEASRAFAKRYLEKFGRMPNMNQASAYGAVTHYLKSVEAAGAVEPGKVLPKMKATPINDFMTKDGSIRADGRVIRDMYLLRAKKPAESKGEWDLLELVKTLPGSEIFKAPDTEACNLVR